MGSYLCYKYLNQKSKERNSLNTSNLAPSLTSKDKGQETSSDEENESPLRIWKKNIRKAKWTVSASTPYLPETPPESDDNIRDLSEDQMTETPQLSSSLLKSFSLSSLNGSIFGDGTVLKLDQLLNQIEDIKKSVVEMDADLFSVEKSKKCNKPFLTIGAQDEGSSLTDTTSPPSPTLEWDSDDINTANFQSYFNDDQETITIVSDLAVEDIKSSTKSLLDLPLEPFSRASSSGKGSSVSSPVIDREKQLREMIEEANKLGLVNDLLKELMRCNRLKRDSAYFEDED